MHALEVRALGKLQLRYVDNRATSFPTRHVEELLGFLLSNQQDLHPREKLVTLLWPESSMSEGRSRFNTVLWRLRGTFEEVGVAADDYLQSTRGWVAFTPRQQFWFDASRFEQQLEQADAMAGSDQREQALVKALSLYQGEYCEGLYADWCLIERERLARLRLRARGQLMSLYMEDGNFSRAIELGEQILQEDPLREEVHKSLMYCYVQAGRPEAALLQFQECVDLLRQELQILPLPETIQLYQHILSERITRSRPAAPTADVWQAFDEFQRAAAHLATLLDESTTSPSA